MTWPFTDVMSFITFKRIEAVVHYKEDDLQKVVGEVGAGEDNHGWIRKWLHACNSVWVRAWEAGTFISLDETVVFWTGLGKVHPTWQPCKPSPLGVILKITCDLL